MCSCHVLEAASEGMKKKMSSTEGPGGEKGDGKEKRPQPSTMVSCATPTSIWYDRGSDIDDTKHLNHYGGGGLGCLIWWFNSFRRLVQEVARRTMGCNDDDDDDGSSDEVEEAMPCRR